MRKLGIFVTPKINESLKHVIFTISNAIDYIGKNSWYKVKTMARWAITNIVNKKLWIKECSKKKIFLNIYWKTFIRWAKRR